MHRWFHQFVVAFFAHHPFLCLLAGSPSSFTCWQHSPPSQVPGSLITLTHLLNWAELQFVRNTLLPPNRHQPPPTHDHPSLFPPPMTVQVTAAHLDIVPMSLPKWQSDQILLQRPVAAEAPKSPDIALDEPLDTPFLRPIGAISRPASFNLGQNPASTAAKTPSPIRTSSSFSCGITPPMFHALAISPVAAHTEPAQPNTASSNGSSSRRSFDVPQAPPAMDTFSGTSSTALMKQVSWVNYVSVNPSTGLTTPQGSFSAKQGVPLPSAHADIWSSAAATGAGSLLSINSAPVLQAGVPACSTTAGYVNGSTGRTAGTSTAAPGDLRDQGRASVAGAGMTGNMMGGAVGPVLGSAFEVAPEDAGTPMQAMSADCINNLLGSLGTSLFIDSTPRAAITRQASVLPDLVDVWEGTTTNSAAPRVEVSTAATAPVTDVASGDRAPAWLSSSHKGSSVSGGRRSSSSSSSSIAGSAFASVNGAVAAAAAATTASQANSQPESLASVGSFGGANQAMPFPHPLANAFSTPVMPRFGPSGSFSANIGASICVATAAVPAAQWQGLCMQGAPNGLQRTSSVSGPVSAGYPVAGQVPTYSNAYAFNTIAGAAPLSGGQVYGPAAQAAVAAMMQLQAYQQSSAIAAAAASAALTGAPSNMYEAWALALLGGNLGAAGFGFEANPGSPLAHSSSGSWSSQPGMYFPPSESVPANWRPNLKTSGSFSEGQPRVGRRAGLTANSKVDPKSMCGVDPRLCVGSPSDVELEVCRRNPGLAELLRLAPRSVKLNNVAVRADTSPPELLASKRADGPITPKELTIESGLLRHCFGLPSSIGPDLVRAARHAVTRGDTAGSGLEPFFWVLQAKLNWLLKRPVFFKGQLLRGEIHTITDQQRAQSFSQVTEQRSKLGELLLVLYRMLQADNSA